jgi:hypothetical protein
MNTDEPRSEFAAVAYDDNAVLLCRSPLHVVGNQPRDVCVKRGTLQEKIVRVVSAPLIERAHMSLCFGDDRLELDAGPRGHVDRDFARIAGFVSLDRSKPLGKSVGLLPRDRSGRQQSDSRDSTRTFQPFALPPSSLALRRDSP